MRLSFVPGDLHLSNSAAEFVLVRGGAEIFRTRSERAAILRFNRVRAEMERNGLEPAAVLTPAMVVPALPQDSAVEVDSRRQQRKGHKRKLPAKPAARIQEARRKAIAKTSSHASAANDAIHRRSLPRIGIQQVLSDLRVRRDRLDQAIDALAALGDGHDSPSSWRTPAKAGAGASANFRRRRNSPEGSARIAAATKARWEQGRKQGKDQF